MTSSPLRVLLATAESHPTHRPDVAVLFGRMLPALGVQVDLLALGSTELAVDRTSPGAPADADAPSTWTAGRAYLRRVRGHVPAPVLDFLQQWQLFALCRQGCDLLIVRDKPVLGVIGWLAARRAGVPFCYWMSYPLPEHYLWLAARRDAPVSRVRRLWLRCRGTLGQQILARVLVPRADWLFVQSQAMLDGLRAGPLQHARASAVPMGVDLTHLPEPAAILPKGLIDSTAQTSSVAPNPAPWAVYLGTLDRARGLEMLIDATLAVARRRPDFRLLVIGEADEPADVGALRKAAERAGALPWMHFTGRLPPQQALALARRAQIGVSPVPRTPLTEVGSPTKAVEYIACGLAVVCNDQPDQAHVVRASGGGRVVAFETQAFAEAILELLDADPVERARQALTARDWVGRHRGYDVIAQQVCVQLHAVARTHVSACRPPVAGPSGEPS
ncbi:MAG: glycosyltransferase [Burkholderiales bacterium]|nr:glycosyltransferase [Burkholderiales bacterium]